ncbi:MAG: POTRA domain-containing protein [Candidatus Zixiibacteriota bacterium]
MPLLLASRSELKKREVSVSFTFVALMPGIDSVTPMTPKRNHLGRIVFVILLWLVLVSSAPASVTEGTESPSGVQDSTLRIGEIRVVRKSVFDPEIKEENRKVFLWVNKLHFLTKERIIRQELLFKPGDIYDQRLLDESERNLRNLGFLGKVKVEEVKQDDGRTDILVKTQDQWSTTAYFSGEAVGNFYSVETCVEEHNLLGWGKSLVLGYTKNTEKETRQLSLLDPNILGTRLYLNTDIYDLSDGHLYGITFARPLYSLETRYAFTSQYVDEEREMDYYEGGAEFFSYQRKCKEFYFEVSKSSGEERKRILSPFYQWEERHYAFYSPQDSSKYTELLPPDRDLQHLGLSVRFWRPRFEKLTYLDNFGRIEDLDLGWSLQGKWGFNLDDLFSKGRTDVSALKLLFPFLLGNGEYLFFSQSAKAEFENLRWERILSQTDLRFYWKMPYWQTLAWRALGIVSSRQEKAFQVVLDGTTGLRGFEKYRFSGANDIVFNFEDRMFTPWRILTVGLGGVLFFDGGYVWNQKLAGQDFHSDVGLGLRLGFTKSHAWRVSRIDFAKSLETNDWVISFGTGMYFQLADL